MRPIDWLGRSGIPKAWEIGFSGAMEVLERLLAGLRRCCAGFPDKRHGANASYTMADLALAAFSVFFMQSPSFLAHQRQLAEGHGRSIPREPC